MTVRRSLLLLKVLLALIGPGGHSPARLRRRSSQGSQPEPQFLTWRIAQVKRDTARHTLTVVRVFTFIFDAAEVPPWRRRHLVQYAVEGRDSLAEWVDRGGQMGYKTRFENSLPPEALMRPAGHAVDMAQDVPGSPMRLKDDSGNINESAKDDSGNINESVKNGSVNPNRVTNRFTNGWVSPGDGQGKNDIKKSWADAFGTSSGYGVGRSTDEIDAWLEAEIQVSPFGSLYLTSDVAVP